ncbi:MAG: HAMP domain-containing sensor histidine kinase [Planctomycetota bacterium]|nr:HAMP domain-containing sensor histidine kinase [Planctomycetota bacterium]
MSNVDKHSPVSLSRRRTVRLPVTLSVILMTLNVALMVCWIILLAQIRSWSALTVGTVVFALILVGLIVYLFVTVKEVRLNQRQANFVDSVTHELKTPIAALRLYLETLQLRELTVEQRTEFYATMERELQRLDHLISQLLEVGRLDAIGHLADPEDISLDGLLRDCAESACAHHKKVAEEIVTFEIEPTVVHTRRLILEMIFRNLLDNAVKYAGEEPEVLVRVQVKPRGRVCVQIIDNGEGVPSDLRKQIFRMFYRGENELERRQKGTGLGLYISRTLTQILKGSIAVHDRPDGPGSVFEVELPGRPEA